MTLSLEKLANVMHGCFFDGTVAKTDDRQIQAYAKALLPLLQAEVQAAVGAAIKECADAVNHLTCRTVDQMQDACDCPELVEKILSLHPDALKALERRLAQERLAEAKWWALRERQNGPTTLYPNEQERIAALEKAAG